jgi:predicted transcriptional regulator
MHSTRPAVAFVTDPQQWSVLNSPIRLEIAEMLRCIAPCSVAELAEALHRPADTLYRQLEQLEQSGFVRRVGYRKVGRHAEQLVDLTASDFIIDFDEGDALASGTAVAATAKCAMHGVVGAIEAAAAAGAVKVGRREQNASLLYELSWLTPERFAELRTLLQRVKQLLDEGKVDRKGDLYLTVGLVSPVIRKHRARRRTPRGGRPQHNDASRGTA